MKTRKRGSGYFGKTGTVSRERRPRRKMSRREFLAGATATGVALTLPPWLAGCGSDDSDERATPVPAPTPSPTPGARPRERHTLHFDFSFAPLRDLVVNVHNSPSHRAPIVEHTAESRARHRELNPALADVPDERLTHYIEDVDLPSDALQLVWITGTHADSGEDVVAGVHVHAPAGARLAAHRRAQAAGGEPRRSATALAYGIGRSAPPQAEGVLMGTDNYHTPVATAVALVFHNHEIMNLNVDQGTTILQLIQTLPCTDDNCTPYLASLATQIAEKWPASTTGGWATLVPLTDENDEPVVDSAGNQIYRNDLDPEIAQSVGEVAKQIRKAIFDDPQFRGTNWHPTQGTTVSQSGAEAGLKARTGIGGTGLAVTAAYGPGTTNHGVAFTAVDVTDQTNRTVQIQCRNEYLRYLSTYVQFANEGGDLQVANPTSKDTSRAKFLAWINSNYTILGIPLLGDDIPLSSVQFDVPADASIAKVYFGSLGLGGDAFSPEALDGAILTLLLNIAIPTILMVAGAVVSAKLLNNLTEMLTSPTVLQALNATLPLVLAQSAGDITNGVFGMSNSSNAVDALVGFANAVVTTLFATLGGQLLAPVLEAIAEAIAEDTFFHSAPFVGLALTILAVLADLATIAESVAEVLSSPAIFINQISLTQTTTVTISHDPDDFQFPATARHYDVRLTYDSVSKVVHQQSGPIEAGRVDPIVVAFDNVPSGGMVTVEVYLTTESGCIVGRSTGTDGTTVGPYGPVSGTQTAIDLTIKELLIPLTQTTQYLHDVKLEYQNGAHVWVETAAPTATIADLGQGQDAALYDLNGITISQRTGMAGYAYRAGGQGVPFCDQTTSGIMYMVQNLFLAENPDRGLKQLPCGFEQVAGVVYDRLGPASGNGRNFFLRPAPQGFLVQSIVLDDTTPIDVNNTLSWGVFSQALDSLAVVPTGYVVGVNRQNHKMEILELPSAPSSAQAPQAVPFAVVKMGLGTREGLLSAPVAVTVIDATILILEDGNQRIQAVDVSGNPVPRFQNGTSSVVMLDQGSGITYLDLGVEGMGYIYVLSFVNNGLTAADYRLDVYDPQGSRLIRTTGVAAARLAVDTFRNVYTLNYEAVANAPRIEPSLSQWNPSTPEGCPTPPPTPSA